MTAAMIASPAGAGTAATAPMPRLPAVPAAPAARPAPGPLRNGNPRCNPNPALRCGAKARTTGGLCQAPAMANGRCRMHGGNCIGPATPEGRARMIKANTKHGAFTAAKRAEHRYVRTLITRNRLLCAARRLRRYLPPEMAVRLAAGPAELAAPVHPSNLPFLKPQDAMLYTVKTGPAATGALPAACDPSAVRVPSAARTRAARSRKPTPPRPAGRAAERLAARAEAAALAPWRKAIAFARAAGRAARQARRATRQARAAARKTQLPGRNAMQSLSSDAPAARRGGENATPVVGLPARDTAPTPQPNAPWCDLSVLEREVAARLAGLRARGCSQPPGQPARTPDAESEFPGRNAIQGMPSGAPAARPGGEAAAHPDALPPGACPGGATPATPQPPAPSPLSHLAPGLLHAASAHHPSPPTPSGGQTENPGRNALQSLPPGACPGGLPTFSLPPGLTRWGACPGGERPAARPLAPIRAVLLRTTTLSRIPQPNLRAQLTQRFGLPTPTPNRVAPLRPRAPC